MSDDDGLSAAEHHRIVLGCHSHLALLLDASAVLPAAQVQQVSSVKLLSLEGLVDISVKRGVLCSVFWFIISSVDNYKLQNE